MLPNTIDEVTRHNLSEVETIFHWIQMNTYGLSLGIKELFSGDGSDQLPQSGVAFVDFMVDALESSVGDFEYWCRLALNGDRYK